jgi:hypothetical protein
MKEFKDLLGESRKRRSGMTGQMFQVDSGKGDIAKEWHHLEAGVSKHIPGLLC